VAMTTKLHENMDILVLMDLLSPNFNDGSRNAWGFLGGNFNSNLLCTT
jgi:hypothetical protein